MSGSDDERGIEESDASERSMSSWRMKGQAGLRLTKSTTGDAVTWLKHRFEDNDRATDMLDKSGELATTARQKATESYEAINEKARNHLGLEELTTAFETNLEIALRVIAAQRQRIAWLEERVSRLENSE